MKKVFVKLYHFLMKKRTQVVFSAVVIVANLLFLTGNYGNASILRIDQIFFISIVPLLFALYTFCTQGWEILKEIGDSIPDPM